MRAHAVVSEIFDLNTLWDDIYTARLTPTLTNSLIIEARRLLDRASRWFLTNRSLPPAIDTEINRFGQPIAMLRGKLASMLRGSELAAATCAQADLVTQGIPIALARNISESLYAFSLLDIIEVAVTHNEDATHLAHIYFELSDHLGVDDVLLAVSSLPRGGRWHSLARLALRDDLYRSLRGLALDVSRRVPASADPVEVIAELEAYNRPRLDRARRTLTAFRRAPDPDLAVYRSRRLSCAGSPQHDRKSLLVCRNGTDTDDAQPRRTYQLEKSSSTSLFAWTLTAFPIDHVAQTVPNVPTEFRVRRPSERGGDERDGRVLPMQNQVERLQVGTSRSISPPSPVSTAMTVIPNWTKTLANSDQCTRRRGSHDSDDS